MSDAREVARWWAENPMTYGDAHGAATWGGAALDPGTRAFYERLDAEFLSWNRPLHGRAPFDRLFPFDAYGAGARVLEIGCGMGTMAALWAGRGARVTAVDLNPVAVARTRRRFELFGLAGEVLEADGRNLPFADGAFDYVYSWGVLHHSPELARSLAELLRVARPGGGFGLMLYNRASILYRYQIRFVEGWLHRERAFLSERELASRYGDAAREEGNPWTWPVTAAEVAALLGPGARGLRFRRLGTELDFLFKLLLPGLGLLLPAAAKKPWARRFGWSLWAEGRRA